jgi:hypothetical protein
MAWPSEAVLLQQEIERDLPRPRELTNVEIHEIITARATQDVIERHHLEVPTLKIIA